VVAKRRGRPPKQRADAAEQSSGGSDANPAEQASENLSIKVCRYPLDRFGAKRR